MKTTIGDRIRAVLEKYPEIRRNRAKINAIAYSYKHDPNSEPRDIQWNTSHSSTDTCLIAYRRNKDGVQCDMEIIHMKALSEYKYDPAQADTFISSSGVKLPAVKLVFNDG